MTIMDVRKDGYFAAIEIGEDLKLEPNAALAIDIMRQNGIEEIYSFNEHFNQIDGQIDGITRLPGIHAKNNLSDQSDQSGSWLFANVASN